jgi:hypothetical protein
VEPVFAILKGREVVLCDKRAWVNWLVTNPDRRVDFDRIGAYEISTVFLLTPYAGFPPFGFDSSRSSNASAVPALPFKTPRKGYRIETPSFRAT